MTTLDAPPRTHAQRLAALEEANRIRCARAHLKRDVKAGRQRVSPLILDPPDWMESMKVHTLLMALPRVGRVKAAQAVKQMGCQQSVTLGALSRARREDLVYRLGGR